MKVKPGFEWKMSTFFVIVWAIMAAVELIKVDTNYLLFWVWSAGAVLNTVSAVLRYRKALPNLSNRL